MMWPFVVFVFVLVLSFACICICICLSAMATEARTGDAFSTQQPAFLSVRHLTDSLPPLSICIPRAWTPCKRALQAISAMGGSAAMRPVVHRDRDTNNDCDLICSDLVSIWMGGGMGDLVIVAPCPGNDLELIIVACLGSNGLPQTPLTSAGLELRQVAMVGDTVVCAGLLEQRLINDLWASMKSRHPPILTSLQAPSPTSTVAFMRPKGHPDVLAALGRPNAVTVIPPKLDASIFAILQPLAKLTGPAVTSTCVFVGNASLDNDPRVVQVVHALTYVDPFSAMSELNYAAKVLPDSLLPSTVALLRPMNLIALSRQERGTLSDSFYGIPRIPVLQEGYSDQSITLQADTPVEAYMTSTTRDGRCRVLAVRHPYIGAARMRPGDRVVLRDQTVSKHNGNYIVTTTGVKGTVLVSWVEADYDAVSFTDEKTVGAMTARLDAIKGLWPRVFDIQVADRMLLRNLNNPNGIKGVWTTVTSVNTEGTGTVTIQTLDLDLGHTAASDGSCMTSPTTEIKSVCKADGGLWDAPCTSDDQCPYFQKNTEYPNYRGGCLDSGWCEMPLGVTQPSYRTAIGKAFSHGMLDIAFPLDQYERYVFGLT